MAGRGPAPDPNSFRSLRSEGAWTVLPAGGRSGPVPLFPLLPIPGESARTARELAAWAKVWATPQAVMWERSGWFVEVAAYVRMLVKAEQGDLRALGEMRQWSDRLGLNPAAMLRNRWRIEVPETTRSSRVPRKFVSVRDRARDMGLSPVK
jgi:hypothetical protein